MSLWSDQRCANQVEKAQLLPKSRVNKQKKAMSDDSDESMSVDIVGSKEDAVMGDDDGSADGAYEIEISTAPSLYLRPVHFRQTRKRGKIFKTVTERYLRDDLGLGCHYVDVNLSKRRGMSGKEASVGKPKVVQNATHLLSLLKPCKPNSIVVCDTNVLLHNLDVLEQSRTVMPNLVFPQSSLIECKSNRMVAYDRAVEILCAVGGASPRCCIYFSDQHHAQTAHVEDTTNSINDENDARIRQVAALFGEHLRGSNVRVILLTDDSDSRKRARESGRHYEAKSVRSWVKELEKHNPGTALLDLVAQYGSASSHSASSNTISGGTSKQHFPSHVNATDLSNGVKSGAYYRGVFRSVDSSEGRVTIRQGDERVAVTLQGDADRNRSVDGDVVAIDLHGLDQWISSTTAASTGSRVGDASAKKTGAGIATDTAEPSQSDITNVPDAVSVADQTKMLRPTGRVVGIIRRNFANYTGSIYAKPVSQRSTSGTKTEISEQEAIASRLEREHPDGSITCVFFPADTKIPPILIRTTQRERFVAQRIVVSIDSWPADSPYPLGHYIKVNDNYLFKQKCAPDCFLILCIFILLSNSFNTGADNWSCWLQRCGNRGIVTTA